MPTDAADEEYHSPIKHARASWRWHEEHQARTIDEGTPEGGVKRKYLFFYSPEREVHVAYVSRKDTVWTSRSTGEIIPLVGKGRQKGLLTRDAAQEAIKKHDSKKPRKGPGKKKPVKEDGGEDEVPAVACEKENDEDRSEKPTRKKKPKSEEKWKKTFLNDIPESAKVKTLMEG